MSQCIYCYRCVRICDEVQGQFVWQVWNRGDQTRIRPDSGTLFESSCVSCGACANACPSGAIQDKSALTHDAPTAWTKTTCPYCGTGCEMHVGVRDNRIVRIEPVSRTGSQAMCRFRMVEVCSRLSGARRCHVLRV
jgi:formate dehydrogenase major subunit